MFGKTRQGYYKQINHFEKEALQEEVVLSAVIKTRKKAKTKRWGVRKLQTKVNKELHSTGFQIGRDALFDLLRANNMLVRKRKRKIFTTDSHHWLKKFDNLTLEKELTAPNQLWVSDMTYILVQGDDPFYLYLITDAYSQKIVGWHLSLDLKASSAFVALKEAIRSNKGRLSELIHHSDRGVQYCSKKYTELLKKKNIDISMTNPASPQENAIAERVNGILKEEWLYDMKLESLKIGQRKIRQIIDIYNTYRPHNSLDNKVPEEIHSLALSRHKMKRIIGKSYKYNKLEKSH